MLCSFGKTSSKYCIALIEIMNKVIFFTIVSTEIIKDIQFCSVASFFLPLAHVKINSQTTGGILGH